ncbi:MAG: DUF4835 family protein [Sphingobacteriales bacterium]|nr:MAG: DUF4835 family protein [Sphingobacteriales bacterium]
MLKKSFSVLMIVLLAVTAKAQELNCKVKVLSAAILNVDKQVFTTMEKSISDFMNTRKWTTDEFGTSEKIDVNIMINLTGKSADEDIYYGTFNIQASRPVYNASYTSPTVNFLDKDFIFKYSQFTPLQFDDNRVGGNDALAANLTAVLAYYAYLVIGLDYDSFSPKGGEDFLKRAQNIVNNAPEQGKAISGWKAVEGNKNRYWLIDQLLSPRFADLRTYWYTMHREGFDKMYNKPDEGKQKILEGIPKLHQVNRDNPASIVLQFFFNAKSNEFVKLLAQVPKEQRSNYISMLSQMDVPNSAKYQSLNR